MSKASALKPPDPSTKKRAPKFIVDQDSKRVRQYEAKVKDILDTDNLAAKLYRDRKLTKREFDEKVLGLGYQIAVRQLVAMGCSPNAPQVDTKALDLFLRRCDAWFAAHEERAPNPDEPAPFKTRAQKAGPSEVPSEEPNPNG